MKDEKIILLRLKSLYLEGLPLAVERRERARLQEMVRGTLRYIPEEQDIERAERVKQDLTRLWLWHRRQLLAMAEGAAGFSEDRGVPDSTPPRRTDEELRRLENEWALARSNRERRVVVREVQELHGIMARGKEDPAVIPKTEEWRRKIAHDPRPSRTVARIYGIGQRTVMRYRTEFASEIAAQK